MGRTRRAAGGSLSMAPGRAVAIVAHRRLDGLRLIALFKFIKAALLIATGYGVHMLLNVTRLEHLDMWAATLTDSFAQRLLLRALDWIEGLGATRIHIVVGVALGYTLSLIHISEPTRQA